MASLFSRADALREFLSGAGSDGGSQSDPLLSLGGYRSSTEAVSLGITVASALSGVSVLYAGGANPIGIGTLTAIDANNLTWKPFGVSNAGPPAAFSGSSDTEIVEGQNSGQYLRVTGTTPFSPGAMTVTLAYLINNFWGFDDVSIAQASTGESQYRATIIKNLSSGVVQDFKRWISPLGTPQVSDSAHLASSGASTIVTTGSFSDWPAAGWCNIASSGGILRELVYYTSRNNTQLTVPSAGRALLGTSASAGISTDVITPVPGIAIAIDTMGIQASGSSIQTIANATTSPTGVTWNLGCTASTGLNIGNLTTTQQVGIWVWRQIPVGAKATPAALTSVSNSFSAF